jgi:hypothetical protein
MKPFDLDAALKGAKVVTRDGRTVKIAGCNPDAIPSSQVVYWCSDGIARSCTIHGTNSEQQSLFMAPTERKEWVVRCDEYGGKVCFHGPFNMKHLAETCVNHLAGDATIHEITIIE